MRSKNWNVSMKYLNVYEINSKFFVQGCLLVSGAWQSGDTEGKNQCDFRENGKGVGRTINKE